MLLFMQWSSDPPVMVPINNSIIGEELQGKIEENARLHTLVNHACIQSMRCRPKCYELCYCQVYCQVTVCSFQGKNKLV